MGLHTPFKCSRFFSLDADALRNGQVGFGLKSLIVAGAIIRELMVHVDTVISHLISTPVPDGGGGLAKDKARPRHLYVVRVSEHGQGILVGQATVRRCTIHQDHVNGFA